MEACDWKWLPRAGGVMDQDEAEWEDLTTLMWLKQVFKEMKTMGSVQTSVSKVVPTKRM